MQNQPTTLFCIPTDVWRYIILKDFNFDELKIIALVCKGFSYATRIPLLMISQKFFAEKTLVLELSDDTRKAYLYLRYIRNQFQQLPNVNEVCSTFGLVKKEWDAIKRNVTKHGIHYTTSIVFIEVLRYRKTFAEYLKQLKFNKIRRKQLDEARERRRQAERDESRNVKRHKKEEGTQNGLSMYDNLLESESLSISAREYLRRLLIKLSKTIIF